MKTIIYMIALILLPVVMVGQVKRSPGVTASATASATIVNSDIVQMIPDSSAIHFRVSGGWNTLITVTVTNKNGTVSSDILTSSRTDLLIQGRETDSTTVIFNYN